jgi:hypothetical protein
MGDMQYRPVKVDLNRKALYDARSQQLNPNTRAFRNNDRRINFPPAGKPFLCAWYTLEYVIDTYLEICKRYGHLVELLRLPGCQILIDDWSTYSTPANVSDDATAMNVIPTVIKEKHGNNTDFAQYTQAIQEFVLLTFNRQIDRENQKPKVTTVTLELHAAMEFRTLANYYGISPAELERYIDIRTEDAMTLPKNSRIRNQLSSLFTKFDWDMSHKAILLRGAEQWFKCRVSPGSIEQYLDDESKSNRHNPNHPLTSDRVSHELEEYDIALGYQR